MVKVAAVSSEAMHAQNRAISSRRSPISEGDAVKAPPRQSANRSQSDLGRSIVVRRVPRNSSTLAGDQSD